MKNIYNINQIWDSGRFVGINKSHHRVTVEPDWYLNLSTDYVSGSIGKGPSSKKTPFRWYQRKTNDQVEVEIPNVSTITTDRSIDTDAATCDITLFNQWMEDNDEANSLAAQLGEPGWFTWSRGQSPESQSRWNHEANSWANVIVPNALIRTYQGYGGYEDDGVTPLSIDLCLSSGFLTLTGVWLVDTLNYGTDGMLQIHCRDMAKLLLDQSIFPPFVPSKNYPLEYCRWIDTSFDAPFRKRDVPPSEQDIIPTYIDSSADRWYGPDALVHGHKGSDSIDGTDVTFSLSVGNGSPDRAFCTDWWEYGNAGDISSVYVHPWGGNYTMYISIMENGVWQSNGEGLIPYDMSELIGTNYDDEGNFRWVDTGANIPFVMKTGVPWEEGAWYSLPRQFNAEKIRITFRDHTLSPWGQWYYRCGIRMLRLRQKASLTQAVSAVPFVFSIVPYRLGQGYWAVADDGQVFAFGQAREHIENSTPGIDGTVISMYPQHDMSGYWLLQTNGRVHAHGSAFHHGDGPPASDYIDMAPTPSGNGYWLLRRNGTVVPCGDAPDLGSMTNTFLLQDPVESYIGTGIESHPIEVGYWVVNGNGYVENFGTVPDLGSGWQPYRHDMQGREWVRGIVRNNDGDGYYLLGGGAHIHAAGAMENHGVDVRPTGAFSEVNPATYADLTWSLTPTPEGGALVIQANGTILYYGDGEYWGEPGKRGSSRQDGNYLDYSDIVRDMLLWSGFWFAEENPSVQEKPAVYGNIEDTGIYSEECLKAEEFDKKTPMEVITMLKEIVGYNFYIDDEGAARFEAPNWWSIGNYLNDGTPWDVLPEIDEELNLIEYSVSQGDSVARSEIMVSTEQPEKGNFNTQTTRITPGTAAILRGMVKPVILTNGVYKNPDEQRIMAELISMHIWFQMRQGSITIPANPCIQIDDQIRVFERITGESYVHYVRGINTSADLQTGVYKMTLTTHWLGNETDWAITKDKIPDQYMTLDQMRLGISSELVEYLENSPSKRLKYAWMGFDADNAQPTFKSTADAPVDTGGAGDGV